MRMGLLHSVGVTPWLRVRHCRRRGKSQAILRDRHARTLSDEQAVQLQRAVRRSESDYRPQVASRGLIVSLECDQPRRYYALSMWTPVRCKPPRCAGFMSVRH